MSKPGEMKSMNWNSATGRMPISAAPHAAPTIAASDIGVSITRPLPNSSRSPSVTLNAPPYAPTSSPMRNTSGSRSISSHRPCLMASTNVTTPPRAGRFDLCSFLVAVDILVLKADASLDVGHGDVGTLRVDDEALLSRVYDHVHAFYRYRAQEGLGVTRKDHCPHSRRAVLEPNLDRPCDFDATFRVVRQ